jgi:hypothetical protein
LLESELRKRGKKIEVLNCGITGSGTGQQYLAYLQKIAPFQPDMLIVAYHLGDTDDNVGGGTNPPRPTFLLDGNKNLQVDFRDVDKWMGSESSSYYTSCDWVRRFVRSSGVLSKVFLDLSVDPVYKNIARYTDKPISFISSKFFNAFPKANLDVLALRQVLFDDLAIRKPAVKLASSTITTVPLPVLTAPKFCPNPSLESGQLEVVQLRGMLKIHQARVDVTKEIVRKLNAACSRQHCRLVIAALPANDNSMFFYRELNELRNLAAEEQFQFIDSWKSFPARPPMSESPYHYISHFNCAGHALMTKTLCDNLSDLD